MVLRGEGSIPTLPYRLYELKESKEKDLVLRRLDVKGPWSLARPPVG